MENNLVALVCDDSILIRKKFHTILTQCGCKTIFEAENGVQAVEQAIAQKPDVIFLDIVMPDKDGIEALKEIKVTLPEVKIIMASSAGTSNLLKEALKNGAYDFLQKPITLEKVVSLLEKILKEAK